MSESDYFPVECPRCDETHQYLAPNRSVASFIFLNNIKPSYVYRCHMFTCSQCMNSQNVHKFSSDDLQKILKELTLYDKRNGEFLNPTKRTRSDMTSRKNHLAITPTFPDKNSRMTKYKMEKLLKKITTLDPESQIEAHFEIGGDSGEGIYHYHIYAITKMSLCAQNNKILSNIMEKNRIDLKTLKDNASIGKWRNYIRKDLSKFEDKRLEFPSYHINLEKHD